MGSCLFMISWKQLDCTCRFSQAVQQQRYCAQNFISIIIHRQEFMCLPEAEILQKSYEVLKWKLSFIEKRVVFPPEAEICRTFQVEP